MLLPQMASEMLFQLLTTGFVGLSLLAAGCAAKGGVDVNQTDSTSTSTRNRSQSSSNSESERTRSGNASGSAAQPKEKHSRAGPTRAREI